MATPRKHWFRMADSVGREPISNDQLATLTRLMCELNTRWARDGLTAEQACRATFRPGDLVALTGSASLVRARRIMKSLEEHFSITSSLEGAYTTIEWRKWAEFQELPTPTEGNSKADSSPRNSPSASAPSSSPASSPSEEKENAPPALVLVEPEVESRAWVDVVEAMAAYVPSRSSCVSSTKRAASMARIVKQFGPSAPVDAIHGYAAMHFGKPVSDGFDPETNFTVETIWSGKVAKYLDADREARDSGRVRPYLACQKDSVRDMTLRIAAQIKSERGWLDG